MLATGDLNGWERIFVVLTCKLSCLVEDCAEGDGRRLNGGKVWQWRPGVSYVRVQSLPYCFLNILTLWYRAQGRFIPRSVQRRRQDHARSNRFHPSWGGGKQAKRPPIIIHLASGRRGYAQCRDIAVVAVIELRVLIAKVSWNDGFSRGFVVCGGSWLGYREEVEERRTWARRQCPRLYVEKARTGRNAEVCSGECIEGARNRTRWRAWVWSKDLSKAEN